jgi:hypothetical protein
MHQDRPTAASGVVARNVGGETVLVPVRAGVADFNSIFILSKVGAYIWSQLDGSRSRAELCRLICERYAVPAGRDVAADLDDFLAQLDRRGLVESSQS